MKRPSWRILIFLIYILNTAKASTSLRFYDDTDCQDTHSVLVTGPENGLCTPINAPYGYGSYKLDNISAGYGGMSRSVLIFEITLLTMNSDSIWCEEFELWKWLQIQPTIWTVL